MSIPDFDFKEACEMAEIHVTNTLDEPPLVLICNEDDLREAIISR